MPIVVLVPVKNESWILDRFLAVTSQFADKIIIADQMSSDHTRNIAIQYDKVHLIENNNAEYDEHFRQSLLLERARELVPGDKVLLALDADEVITADSLHSADWVTIFSAPKGTRIYFEKPDLVFPLTKCIRHDDYHLLGFIDDGSAHAGKKIHSPRLPGNSYSPLLYIEHIKFMHYARVRNIEYRSRQRYYSVIENINGTRPFYGRLRAYSDQMDYLETRQKVSTPDAWITGWEKMGIDMTSVYMTDHNYFNLYVLDSLRRYGGRRFFLDDIWSFDWNAFQQSIYGGGQKRIETPNILYALVKTVAIKILQ